MYVGLSVVDALMLHAYDALIMHEYDSLMLHASRRPSSDSPRSGFVPHAQASAPPRIYGKRLELAEGTSPRELPCHCAGKTGKPSKERRDFRLLILNDGVVSPSLSPHITSLRVCAGPARSLFVLEGRLCSLG